VRGRRATLDAMQPPLQAAAYSIDGGAAASAPPPAAVAAAASSNGHSTSSSSSSTTTTTNNNNNNARCAPRDLDEIDLPPELPKLGPPVSPLLAKPAQAAAQQQPHEPRRHDHQHHQQQQGPNARGKQPANHRAAAHTIRSIAAGAQPLPSLQAI
jgi:hypothetical protein